MAIYMWRDVDDRLCFTANTAGSTVQLTKTGSPTAVNLETSANGTTWTDYTIGDTITLSNIGDKVYMRNKSETTTGFSDGNNWYKFVMSGSIAGSGDVNYLINKNSTDTLTTSYCFVYLFSGCSSLTTAPKLPATTLTAGCYSNMFFSCSNLTMPPELPATTLTNYCYSSMFQQCYKLEGLLKLPATTLNSYCYAAMFRNCTKIKLSNTQTGEYQTAYRIPTTGTGTGGNVNSLAQMFGNTGGTFTGAPTINTTYYTSNTVI